MFTQLYTGFVKKPDDSEGTLDFILMCAFLALAVTLLVAPIMSVSSETNKLEDTLRPSHFSFCYAILVAMGVAVTTSAFAGKFISAGGRAGLAVLILLIWLSPSLLLTGLFGDGEDDAEEEQEDDAYGKKEKRFGIDEPLLIDAKSDKRGDGGGREEGEEQGLTALPELALGETIKTSRFYLLLWTCMWLIGAGIMISNNVTQVQSINRTTSPRYSLLIEQRHPGIVY
jgi:hypothetical protein